LRQDFNLNSSDDLKFIFPPISEYHHGMEFHGGWILDCPLGKGSFGEVWKAHHVDAPTAPMALKICSDKRGRISLKREVGLIRTIKSKLKSCKGISHLLSESLDADPPHLVYEYINGGDLVPFIYSLNDFQDVHKRTVEASKVIIEIAQTLSALHNMKPPIVHRDIKPSNILVRKSAINNRFVISDFGIGCLQLEASSIASSLGAINVKGHYTKEYASPEQIRGDISHPKDDIRALGVVFYQMLVANSEETPGISFKKKLEKQGVNTAIIQVINSMIEDDRDDRIDSLLEVISQLRDILGLKEKQTAKKIAKLSHLGNYSWPSGIESHWNNIVVSGVTESDLKYLLQQNGLPDRIGLKNLLAKSNLVLPTVSDIQKSKLDNFDVLSGRGIPVRECPDKLYYPSENTMKYPAVGSPIALIAMNF
jgi:serine/threonine protein kinase